VRWVSNQKSYFLNILNEIAYIFCYDIALGIANK